MAIGARKNPHAFIECMGINQKELVFTNFQVNLDL